MARLYLVGIHAAVSVVLQKTSPDSWQGRDFRQNGPVPGVAVYLKRASASASASAGPPSVARDLGCSQVGVLRAKEGVTPIDVTFVNSTSDPIQIIYLNYDGKPVKYNDVPPGGRVRQPTFRTHPWMVADAAGRCLHVFLPDASQEIRIGSQQ